MPPAPQTGILIVDDDRELVCLMDEFLREQGFETAKAYDGPDGLSEALTGAYDLVLLDVMMPGFDGFELLQRLRAESQVPVLIVTARLEAQSRILGLEGGADDYLPKPFEPLELVARIRAILRRTKPSKKDAALEISGVRLDPGTRSVKCNGMPIELTSFEYEVLEVLIRSAGRVVSRDEVARRLYERDALPLERSLDVHISHLRKKLEGPHELIRTVRGVGYQFAVQEIDVRR